MGSSQSRVEAARNERYKRMTDEILLPRGKTAACPPCRCPGEGFRPRSPTDPDDEYDGYKPEGGRRRRSRRSRRSKKSAKKSAKKLKKTSKRRL